MPKQIKLTDRVAEKLAQRAKEDNLSLAGEVDKLLSVDVRPAEYSDNFVFGKLEYLENYIDKKFGELKSLIEDTTVDRVAGRQSSQDPVVKKALSRKDIDWPIVQDLIYEFLDERAPEWFPGAASGVRNMDDTPNCFIKDEVLYFENQITGGSWPVLHISSRVQQFLDSHAAS